MAEERKVSLGYKEFDRLCKSIGLSKEFEGDDSLRRFESWTKNAFHFFINLAKHDYIISAETERNLLIRCLSEEMTLRLEDTLLPQHMGDFTADELINHVRTFFRRTVNMMVERVRLHRRQQQTEETVQEYMTALKQIAANCRFDPPEYSSRLRDVFVAGLRDEMMLQKFYENENLLSQTLDQVLTFARTLEGARNSVAALRDSNEVPLHHLSSARVVSRIDYRKTNDVKRPRDRSRRKLACFICGSKDHYIAGCSLRKFRDSLVCRGCGKQGHIASGCLKKRYQARQPSRLEEIGEAEQPESVVAESDTESELSPEGVDSVCKEVCEAGEVHCVGKKLIVNLEIERKEVQFRVDTGADVSLLDECSWEKLGKPALSATTDKLRNASGKLMIFKGTVKKQVRFRNSIMEVLFYVKHGRGSNLLGMDWIKKTGLLNACAEF